MPGGKRSILKATFAALEKRKVFLPGVILKTNMVLSGSKGPQASEAEVVKQTLATLQATVPPTTGAVVFLSGGQSTEAGMARLEAIRKAACQAKVPYPISSSFSRALQGPALEEFGAAVKEQAGYEGIKKRTAAKFSETLKMNETALQNSVCR